MGKIDDEIWKEIDRLQRQIDEIEANLSITEAAIREHVSRSTVPLQYWKDKRNLEEARDKKSTFLKALHALVNKDLEGKQVPQDLPYSPDRSEQEHAIAEVLERLHHRSQRPLAVFLIHGDERQSHDMFLYRLRTKILPKWLALDPHRACLANYALEWPDTPQSADNLQRQLIRKLAEAITKDPFAKLEKINGRLVSLPAPAIVHTSLYTEDWRDHGHTVMENFLRFWQTWPDLSSGQWLFVCVMIKYQHPGSKGLFDLKPRTYKMRNEKIERQLSKIAHFNSDRLECAILPKLKNVTRTHVEAWAQGEEIKRYCAGRPIDRQVVSLFDDDIHEMPMDDLGRKLLDLLAWGRSKEQEFFELRRRHQSEGDLA